LSFKEDDLDKHFLLVFFSISDFMRHAALANQAISIGTVDRSELIARFAVAIKALEPECLDNIIASYGNIDPDDDEFMESFISHLVLEDLIRVLMGMAPDGFEFGMTEDERFGFWPVESEESGVS